MSIKPILYEVKSWDATEGTKIYFKYTGGRRAIGNRLSIKNLSSGLIEYEYDYNAYEKVHEVPANVLSNGVDYSAKISVILADSTYTDYSTEVEFKCLSNPVVDIITIDNQGYIYNSDVTFEASYTQAQNILASRYRFKLYDEKYELINSYPLRTVTTDSPNMFSETIEGLEKNKRYYVECVVELSDGTTYNHSESFIPLFLTPSMYGGVTVENIGEEGFIEINSNIREISASQAKTDNLASEFTFIDNEWITTTDSNVLTYKELGMFSSSSFVVKAWCKNVTNDSSFLTFKSRGSNSSMINFEKRADRVIVSKTVLGITSIYSSNIVAIPDDKEFMVYAKIENGLGIEVVVTII